MKKYFEIALLAVVPFILSAINIDPKMGFKIGMNFSTLNGFGTSYSNSFDEDMEGFTSNNIYRKPMTLGFFIFQDFSYVSLQLEANLSRKGIAIKSKSNPRGGIVTYTSIFKVNYFEFPLLVKYCFSTKKMKSYVYAGPSISILNASTYYIKIKVQDASDSDETDYNIYKNVDYGLNFGFDFHSPNNVILDFRYTMGLTNIIDETKLEYDVRDEWKNSVFNFSLGFMF